MVSSQLLADWIGATIEVSVTIDDKAEVDAATEEGTRKDGPQTLQLTLTVKEKEGGGGGGGIPTTPTPTPTPVVPPVVPPGPGPGPNPNPTPTPTPVTPPALPAISLNANATDATTIALSWSDSAGTLYRSQEKEFAPSDETHIDRGADESDDTKLSYTDRERTPATLYYYILVPKSPNFSQGKAQAETPDIERSAEASFTLLKADGNAAGATIGGAVTVVFEIELENAEAGSENAVVRIQETGTEGEVTHETEEDHVDLPALDFTKKEGWQQWLDDDGDGPQPASWKTATSEPVGTGKWRWSYAWNTAGAAIPSGDSKLLNHNGEHTISLAKVDGDEGSNTLDFGDESADVEEKKATVGNLVIEPESVSTSNGTSDYFKFNPTAEEGSNLLNPTVNFTIKDEGDFTGHAYLWRVRVRSTDIEDQTTGVVYEDIVLNTGAIVVLINQARLAADSPSTKIKDWGTYNFNVSVHEYASEADARKALSQPIENGRLDTITLRSADLIIPYTMPSPNQSRKGHEGVMQYNSDKSSELRLSYFLGDTSRAADNTAQAKELKIELIPPTLGDAILTETSWPRFLNAPVLDRLLKRFEAGELALDSLYITVISAVDNHTEEYRDHKPASMLAKNNHLWSESSRYDLHIWYDDLNPVSLTAGQRAIMENYISSVFDKITLDFVDDTGTQGLNQRGAYSDGIQAYWHSAAGLTAGGAHPYGPGISANTLSAAQQRGQNADYQTVIINEPTTAAGNVLIPGHVAVTSPYGDPPTYANGHKDSPILTSLLFNTDLIGPPPPPLTAEDKLRPGYLPPIAGAVATTPAVDLQFYSNIALHELLHAALGESSGGSHCSLGKATCIRVGATNKWYNSDMRQLNSITALDDTGDTYPTRSPFHTPDEIYAVLDNMKHGHRTQ